MTIAAQPACANCQRLQAELDTLRSDVESLRQLVGQLQQQLAAARKDSSTSSKPPSSDIVKPPKTVPAEGKRTIGGQPGHNKHERAVFPEEALCGPAHHYYLELCPVCSGGLQGCGNPERVIQQVEVLPSPILIEEHRSHPAWCPRCQTLHYAPMPDDVERGGLVGPRLTTLIAYLKGACHASYSTIRKFLRDVVCVTISRGMLAKVISKVSAALEGPYQELLTDLPGQAHLNVDETGHKENGARMWTWCFRASLYTLFKIDPTRSGDVLIEVLGEEFDGVLGCDFFSAYRRYMREFDVTLQFCLAHLIRDVKYLTTLPDKRERAYGERLREALKQLFCVIHQRQEMTARTFQQRLQAARDEVLCQGTKDVPPLRASQTMVKRLQQYGQNYFVFVTTPGVEPTNNLAEQAIRFVVIDRHITQGTRSEKGQRFCERIWTVMATCTQQGRSVFDYLHAAVKAHFNKQDGPSLLPSEH